MVSYQRHQSLNVFPFFEGSMFLCHYSLTYVGFLGVSIGEGYRVWGVESQVVSIGRDQ